VFQEPVDTLFHSNYFLEYTAHSRRMESGCRPPLPAQTPKHLAMSTPVDGPLTVSPATTPSVVVTIEKRVKNAQPGTPADRARALLSSDTTLAELRAILTEDEIMTPRDLFKQDGCVLSKSMERAVAWRDALEVEYSRAICSKFLIHDYGTYIH